MDVLFDRLGKPIRFDDVIKIMSWELPKIFIASKTAFTSLTKEDSSKGTFSFIDGKTKIDNIPVKVKLQGQGSLNYAKKNLNMTFYTDDSYDDKQKVQFNSWYPTNKIHMKANEHDFSMVRNSVGTKIAYHLMGKNLPGGARGYIDSFPVILYYNEEYMGCYTINLPQEGSTFNFDEENPNHLSYRCEGNETGWATDITRWEYRGDADETDEMKAKLQTVLDVMASPDTLTKDIVAAHFDVDTLLAYVVLAQIGLCDDSLINNRTIATWDGVIWYHIFYDMDYCFGLKTFTSSNWHNPASDIMTVSLGVDNGFFAKILELYADEIKEVYARMRKYGVDVETISAMFYNFQDKWGVQNVLADREKWADDKPTSIDIRDSGTTVYNIETWLTARLVWCDEYFGYTAT